MKILKRVLVILVILLGIGLVALYSVKEDVLETELPTNVYEEDSNLVTIINAKMFELFITSVTDEYTVVEEILNLVVLNSIRENINENYDPLSDCETIECNFIILI